MHNSVNKTSEMEQNLETFSFTLGQHAIRALISDYLRIINIVKETLRRVNRDLTKRNI